MDIIICVILKDYLISKKTIKYLRQNVVADTIYLLTPKHNFRFYSRNFRDKYQVVLIDEEEIVPHSQRIKEVASRHFTCEYRFGWYYQQFLKMNFALSQYAKEHYLIWDGDTIPLNRLTFLENEKMIFTPKTEYHKSYFTTMKRILGYDKSVPYSFIAEHMIIDVAIMRELISRIASSAIEGDIWYEKIIHAINPNEPNSFSEFETYGTYCHINYNHRYTTKELRTFRDCGEKYSRLISKRHLNKLSEKYDTVSLEDWSIPKKIIPRFLNGAAQQYLSLLNRLL